MMATSLPDAAWRKISPLISLICHLDPLLVQRPDVAADVEQHLANARVQVASALVLHKVQVAQKLLKPLQSHGPTAPAGLGGDNKIK